jgi:hypothetical protein
MGITDIIPGITSAVTAAITPATTTPATTTTGTTATSSSSPVSGAVDQKTIAGNFDTFLKLLTTQLRNQNPLDPLDTNQFTQQLVQFAGVEQQLKQNDQLTTLIAIEKGGSGHVGTGLCWLDRRGRRPDGSAQERQCDLEPHRTEAGEHHRHH